MSTNGNGSSNGKHAEESVMKFPCHFVIKIMGKAESAFEQTALGIIQSHFKNINELDIKKRFSKDNNYVSLSVTVYAESKVELDNAYRELSSNKDILMVL